jgi:hypothetical protein
VTRGEALFLAVSAALGSVALAAMLPAIVWVVAVWAAMLGGL